MKEVTLFFVGDEQHARRVRDAIAHVNGAQAWWRIIPQFEKAIDLRTRQDGSVHPTKAESSVRVSDGEHRVILITSHPFTDNFFLHHRRECTLITLADWEEEFAPPSLRAYIIYSLAQALLALETDVSEEMLLRAVHEPAVGCLADFCADNRADIKLGMVAANICPNCEAVLVQYGVDRRAIAATRRIIELVRQEATGKLRLVDPVRAFILMRFSECDENDNAYKYGVRPGLQDVGLTVDRADSAVELSTILEKVVRRIERARFIVAKVDVNNVNVYFELGLAMGLDKEVLLVSESSQIATLPSDLQGWECLTYAKGNYEQLRQAIVDFFRNTYRLGDKSRE